MVRTTQDYSEADVWEDKPTIGHSYPIYKEMGAITVGTSGDGPLVAMARAIQDDAESGGSYILRLGEHMTITMSVEVSDHD